MGMTERRIDARVALERPVKVQCAVTGRYVSGQTDNLSRSGALVAVESPSLFVPGQRLKVGIAWQRGQVVLDSREMADATVVRSFALGTHQHVALRFDRRQELAATA